MISRRKVVATLAVALPATLAPRGGRAQSAGADLPLVGLLSPLSATAARTNVEAFRRGLREVGLIDRHAVRVEYRFADGLPQRLPGLAAELVALDPRVIVAGSAPGALAASKATQSIPIVLVGAYIEPLKLGLVASLARPGGNVTGFTMTGGGDLYGKRLQLLKEALPGVVKVGVMLNPDDPTDAVVRTSVTAAAPGLGLAIEVFELRDRSGFEAAFALARQQTEALFVSQSPLFFSNRADVVALAKRHRLPAIYGFGEFARVGGLLCYSVNLPDMYRRSADYVARLLKGEAPSDLPIQQPTKFELAVNLATAEALGLTIPQSILLRADEVIE
jgi:putative ABC transport system substrate-binding protein